MSVPVVEATDPTAIKRKFSGTSEEGNGGGGGDGGSGALDCGAAVKGSLAVDDAVPRVKPRRRDSSSNGFTSLWPVTER